MTAHSTAIRPTSAATGAGTTLALMDPQQFDQMQRVGKMLALSPLFPEHLRKGSEAQNIANGVLVMNMAVRLREDPLTVAQNIYFVGGRPGWNTTYMIAKANLHGVFKDPIDWDVTGTADKLSATAYAVMKGTGKRVQMTADMEMAKAEGWTRNTKYKSIPETMLRYRSAAALIRMYCPEVMIGIPLGIEVETDGMRDVTPTHARDVARDLSGDQEADDQEGSMIEDAETVEDDQPEQSKHDAQPAKEEKRQQRAADHTDNTPQEQRPSRNKKKVDDAGQGSMFTPSLSEQIKMIDTSIRELLAEGTPLDEALEMFDAQLDAIRSQDADEHAAMIEDFKSFAAKRDG
ncbi:hypothetical protein PAF17_15875 [Paracoccus sp. Z330]|uniref:RecT family protein n=1 Tax=Paracoccus onchidii TaxID=3017813 RepID=A0ABT4ZI04_9RHOB|nr:hypothetical protein [Paracoccus onchidii]MDB6178970.1 hypothetical protein [Paracoccus onchidii]